MVSSAVEAGADAPVALITGGVRGIGAAVARRLGQAGYRLVLSYRSDDAAASGLSRELDAQGVQHAMVRADLSLAAEPDRLAAEAGAHFGRLDAVVSNAGITDDAAFLTQARERYAQVLATNFLGAARLVSAALPQLSRSPAPALVVVASLGGIAGKEGQVAYAASKGALIGMVQWLGRRHRGSGLRVNAVAPGFIQTDMMAGLSPAMTAHVVQGAALRRVGQAHEVAEAVAFLLAPGYLQSTTLRVDGGFQR
ncbi:3-oxoacyl-[acyl-carrier protein] reductase [plant metagenome]|uniref:3-oxoacyl-[acyl-carrier protein] reductase n=1 Tax=plant metagenome TaxID=1297885 RepID=A0A484RD53_9ZZZZ